MSAQLLDTQHFRLRHPYTAEFLVNEVNNEYISATAAANANGLSEKIHVRIPVAERTHNMELFLMETVPRFKSGATEMMWDWKTTFVKLRNFMDDDLKEIYDSVITENFPNITPTRRLLTLMRRFV